MVKAAASTLSLLVTVHSFARTTIDVIPEGFSFETRPNEPYSAADGVALTNDRRGAANGLLNVMIETRSDLIRTGRRQLDIADRLVAWTRQAGAGFGRDGTA